MSATGLGWLPGALGRPARPRPAARAHLLRGRARPRGAHRRRAAPAAGLQQLPRPGQRPGACVAGARAALEAYGAGAGASRLVTGSLDLHRRLEERIAALKRCEDALVFPTGFQANVGTIPALVGRGDVVFSRRAQPRQPHRRLPPVGGARSSAIPTPTPTPWRRPCARAPGARRRRLIVTDTVFSMDGDLAPLPAIVEVGRAARLHADGRRGPRHRGARAERRRGARALRPGGPGAGGDGDALQGARRPGRLRRGRPRPLRLPAHPRPRLRLHDRAGAGRGRARRSRRSTSCATSPSGGRACTRWWRGWCDGRARRSGYTVLPTDSAVVGVLIGEAADALAVGAALRAARVWAPGDPAAVGAGRAPRACG